MSVADSLSFLGSAKDRVARVVARHSDTGADAAGASSGAAAETRSGAAGGGEGVAPPRAGYSAGRAVRRLSARWSK